MKRININEILNQKFNDFIVSKPLIIQNLIIAALKKILYIDKINNIIERFEHLDTKHFIMELFEYLNFTFLISNKDLQKIPSQGKVICVANHPIGSLDSLIILKAFLDIRKDVKIVANDVIANLHFLKNHLLPIDLFNKTFQRDNITQINKALDEENAVIVFPAAEVSRLKWFRIKDSKWRNGAIHYAQKSKSPLLPIYIDAKNSILFYIVSIFSKKLSMLLLVHELFNKKNKTVRVIIGDIIPAKVFTSQNLNINYQTKLLKKHVYKLKKNKANVYLTEKSVIHPIDKKILKREIDNSHYLGNIKDNKKIIVTTKQQSPNILCEIARLRELTFRKVGEGTGKMLDLDRFDDVYYHLVVWDENELEIVGSYRIGLGNELLNKLGANGFYTSILFNFSEEFIRNILPNSMELGRSFVQEKYWNTYALDYLWQGIGIYLANNPGIKYLFGPVSISSTYPYHIVGMIIFYFNKWFSDSTALASSKIKFTIPENQRTEYSSLFCASNPKDDYKVLKKMLNLFGYSVPILYKHYSDLCYDDGVRFLDFGVDPDFNNCFDGLILIDISKIKEEKKLRYIKSKCVSEVLT